MKNRSAAHAQNTLLYTKAYRMIAGSVTSTILFQRLEWRFGKYPDGFYKFLEPAPGNPKYKPGDSWCEELGFTADEFRYAFNSIGVRYSSRGEFERAGEPFKRKVKPEEEGGRRQAVGEEKGETELLYCSVLDRKSGLTYYYRNHDLVDRKLDELSRFNLVEEGRGAEALAGMTEGGPSGISQEPSEIFQMPSGISQEPSVKLDLMNHVPDKEHDSSMAHADGTHTGGALAARECVSGLPSESSAAQGGSRHPFDLVLEWARHQPGINSAVALATSRFQDGLADSMIDDWLEQRPDAAHPDKTAAGAAMPGERDDDLLRRFLDAVKRQVNAETFIIWFKPIEQLNRDGPIIHLLVPGIRAREWITANYADVIEDCLRELGLEGSTLHFHYPAPTR
jgi:hypothetical protein